MAGNEDVEHGDGEWEQLASGLEINKNSLNMLKFSIITKGNWRVADS